MKDTGLDIVEIDGIKIDVARTEITSEMVAALRAGTFERAERVIAARHLKPTDRVIEIGTCTGLVAMSAARIVGAQNVFSYEANPVAVELAKHHFGLNGVDVEVTNCLLMPESTYDETAPGAEFFVAPQLVSSSMTARRGRTRIEVPIRSLEREIARRGANVIICDIEGAEIDLFMATDLTGIERILMEEHSRKFGADKVDAMIAALATKGLHFDPQERYGDVIVVSRQRPVSH